MGMGSKNSFLYISTVDDQELPDFPHRSDVLMEMPHFTTAKVRDVILACKSSYTYGPNGCPSKFLKLSPEIYPFNIVV